MMSLRLLICIILFSVLPKILFAYPDSECLGVTGSSPPYSFGFTDTVSGVALADDETFYASYGEHLSIVDFGLYQLAASEPPALSTTDGTDGRLASIAYSSSHNRLYAPQEDGDMLIYDLSNITVKPNTVVIAENSALGPIALDRNHQRAYIADNTTFKVHVVSLSSYEVENSIPLSIQSISSLSVTSALYVSTPDEFYFTTDKGSVFYIPSGGTQASQIAVDATHTSKLTAIAATIEGAYVYVTNETKHTLAKINTSTHAIEKEIALSPNTAPSGIVITQVTNPESGTGNATYAYIAGAKGLSVMNTASDFILDLGTDPDVLSEPLPTSVVPKRMFASSVTDGYVYAISASQTVQIFSANPWVTISSITYSGGASKLGVGGNFVIAFQADEVGTATIRVGGNVAASGTTLKDSTGATSWSVPTVDTDVSVTINYDDNSSAFIEGDNEIFVFVTNSTNDRGRKAGTVSVDTPPPVVTIDSTGFGNERVYVTFNRLDVADMNHYNIYVDTDPAVVLTKTEVTKQETQASSGSTQTAKIDGLANEYIYYVAVEAVDNAGNVSASRASTLPDGTRASAIPQETVGPAGLSGEHGCTLVRGDGAAKQPFVLVLMFGGMFLLVGRRSYFVGRNQNLLKVFDRLPTTDYRRNAVPFLAMTIFFFLISGTAYARQPTPKWGSFEVKTGFWMPQNGNVRHFFGNCCNMVTRVQGGLLVHGRYGVEGGVGVFFKNATAVGEINGARSEDDFSFFLLPMETSFAWRLNYWDWDYVIPYIKAGSDYVFFREGLRNKIIKGVKFGVHCVGGLQLNMKVFGGDAAHVIDDDFGINDIFLTFEAQYQYINNFGRKGLNLSGATYSMGMLFEF